MSNHNAAERGRTTEKSTGRNSGVPKTRTEQPVGGRPYDSDNDENSSGSSSNNSASRFHRFKQAFLEKFRWVGENWTWAKLKPAIRCAVAAWASAILFVIPPVERWMGQASFLILIASFLSPPNDAFVAVVEKELLLLVFVLIAWAWTCLGLKFADLTRSQHHYDATLIEVLDGSFIEAGPSVIIAVFIALGSMFFLYIKARQGPGPYPFACIFGCICLDISLTTAVFFPYPYYLVGQTIFLPLALHTCISFLSSILIFPTSISTTFTTKLHLVLSPLATTLASHRTLLTHTPGTPEFSSLSATLRSTISKSEDGLVGVASVARLLPSDLTYGRFAPEDYKSIQVVARRLTGRMQGLGIYFDLVDPEREMFPTWSVPNTPMLGTPGTGMSKQTSRHVSPERDWSRDRDRGGDENDGSVSVERDVESAPPTPPLLSATPRIPLTPTTSAMSFGPTHSRIPSSLNVIVPQAGRLSPHHSHSYVDSHSASHGRHAHFPSQLLHNSLLNLALKGKGRKGEHAVGVFESQRYLNLEAKRLYDPRHTEHSEVSRGLLRDCCDTLLEECSNGIEGMCDWLATTTAGRFNIFKNKEEKKKREERMEHFIVLRDGLEKSLDEFRNDLRMKVLDPYQPAFAFALSPEDETFEERSYRNAHHYEMPSHRHLFRCYMYQYHLMQIAEIVIEALDEIIKLEKERVRCKLWTPVKDSFRWNRRNIAGDTENDDDDDPDVIQGLHPLSGESSTTDLGLPEKRDPDALPPRNAVEWVMNVVYISFTELWTGNCLFAIKAGVISAILALPFLFKASAPWSYQHRWAWALIMGQLTLSRFRGDTTFGLFARITATFAGCLLGMTMWYISTGGGHGNPYGLAAVCAVCFPFLFFFRLYSPIPPMTNIVGGVTTILVLGYSYQNGVTVLPGSVGAGWEVAWRRFVLVNVGVVAAFIGSIFPPNMTLRRYQRHLLSTTSNELGAIYCAIVSYAVSSDELPVENGGGEKSISTFKRAMKERDWKVQGIVASLIATRSKLRRSDVLTTNIIYEFSLRGRWPKERYQQILDLQLAISFSLSHLMSVLKHLEPAWTRAFLRRARLLDSDFQGDVLAVLTMISTSLRTGAPLPQITPCPLLDRFTLRNHGLYVIHRDAEEDYGLPRALTMATLKDEQYMMFCVGIATAFGIMNRLDRLMVATKELVGEQYHIHGVGFTEYHYVAGGRNRSASAAVANEYGGGTRGRSRSRGIPLSPVDIDQFRPPGIGG